MSGKKAAPFIMIQNIANAIIQFVIAIIITQQVGAELFGHYSLAQSYIMPAFFLGNFSLKILILLDESATQSSDFFAIRTFFASSIFLIAIGITFVFESAEIGILALALAILKFFDGYTEIVGAILQRAQQYFYMLKITLTRLVTLSGTFSAIFLINNNIDAALIGMSAAGFIHFFILEYPKCKKFSNSQTKILTSEKAPWKNRIEIARKGIPLAFVVLIGATQMSLVRIFLENHLGPKILGEFSACLQLVLIGNLFVVALGQSFIPKMSLYYQQNNAIGFGKILLSLSGFVLLAVVSGGVLSYFAGSKIMELIFGNEFSHLGMSLVVASAAMSSFFLNAIFCQALAACKLSHALVIGHLIGLLLTALLPFWFIDNLGLGVNGAYVALFVANIIQVIIFLIAIVNLFRRSSKSYKN